MSNYISPSYPPLPFLPASEAESMMNTMGRRREPFFFFCNWDASRWFVSNAPESSLVEKKGTLARGIVFDFSNAKRIAKTPEEKKGFEWKACKPKRECYSRSFSIVKRGLLRGDSFLTNLTSETVVETDLSLEEMFQRADAHYRILVPGKFVCFSPEIFVKIDDNGRISSFPMKGTTKAATPSALDELMADEKEAAEHATIVDLIRNDLSSVAQGVRVDRYRYAEKIKSRFGDIWTTSSEISGRLQASWNEAIGSIMMRMLPAGSVTGAPKASTINIIRQAELSDRGFYTGICGLFDGQRLDSAVMIRFVSLENGKMLFRSGGGITAMSNEESEYEEVILKTNIPIYDR